MLVGVTVTLIGFGGAWEGDAWLLLRLGGMVQQRWKRWDDEDGGGSWQQGCYGGA